MLNIYRYPLTMKQRLKFSRADKQEIPRLLLIISLSMHWYHLLSSQVYRFGFCHLGNRVRLSYQKSTVSASKDNVTPSKSYYILSRDRRNRYTLGEAMVAYSLQSGGAESYHEWPSVGENIAFTWLRCHRPSLGRRESVASIYVSTERSQ